MPEYIKRFTQQEEYYFKEGCYITEVSNSASDPAVSIVQARVAPGEQTRWHWLEDITERYVIIAGEGLVEVGEHAPSRVSEGDVVIIPASCRQRIRNTGTTDLKFLAICTPRFEIEKYFSP